MCDGGRRLEEGPLIRLGVYQRLKPPKDELGSFFCWYVFSFFVGMFGASIDGSQEFTPLCEQHHFFLYVKSINVSINQLMIKLCIFF